MGGGPTASTTMPASWRGFTLSAADSSNSPIIPPRLPARANSTMARDVWRKLPFRSRSIQLIKSLDSLRRSGPPAGEERGEGVFPGL